MRVSECLLPHMPTPDIFYSLYFTHLMANNIQFLHDFYQAIFSDVIGYFFSIFASFAHFSIGLFTLSYSRKLLYFAAIKCVFMNTLLTFLPISCWPFNFFRFY